MENIKKLRIKHNLSQTQLAEKVHVSQQSIYKYEHDLASPDLDTLRQMSSLFDTSVDYIIGLTEYPGKHELNLDNNELYIIEKCRKLSSENLNLVIKLIEELSKNH